MRILVIGYSGAGKSSFAYKLGQHYHIPVTHIDKLHFDSGWIERDKAKRDQELTMIVDQENWIIDGNYQRAVPSRFELADEIYIFNFNRFKCLYGAIKRRIKYHKKSRNSMTEGNQERLSIDFIGWILFKSRSKKRRAFYGNLKRDFPQKIKEFKTRKQVNQYLLSIGIKDFHEQS